MESLAYNYAMEDNKAMFSTSSDVTTSTESPALPPGHGVPAPPATPEPGAYAAHAPSFHAHSANDLLNMFAQEPRAADVAPASELDDLGMSFGRMGGSEINFDDVDPGNANYLNYFMQGSRAESVASSRSNAWAEGGGGGGGARHNDQMSTFDFLVKSVSAANNYVSMLTREQLHVLQSLRPSLLFEFLQEVAKVRSDKRMRRALPNECAFCKNNGENEECYSQHALKDWRGRVLCPVLRAFRCPRCGATGDRAHTIKYCPENNEAVLERSSGLGARRRAPPSASLPLGSMTSGMGSGMSTGMGSGMSSGMGSGMSSAHASLPQTPTHGGPPPSPSGFNSGLWSSFGI